MALKPPSMPGPGKKPAAVLAIGISPKDKGGPPSDATEPDADDTGGGKIDPEWVLYHGGDELCSACNMYGDGDCTLLKMPVDRNGHCEAFTGGQLTGSGGEESGEGAEDMGGGSDQMGAY